MPRFAQAEGRSLIINIGSADYNLTAYASVYGGSKGCNQAMSSCLNVEMFAEGLGKKIEFLAVSVGEVTETAQKKSLVSLFVPAASTLTKAILQRVGCGISLACRTVSDSECDATGCDYELYRAEDEGDVEGREEEAVRHYRFTSSRWRVGH